MVKLAAFSIALVVCACLIGWLVTWVRLAAARLPVDAALPVIDDKVVFAAGLRTVLLMAVAFAAMCAIAYAHAWTWNARAPEWHEVVRSGRAHVHAYMRRAPRRSALGLSRPTLRALKPQGPPSDLHEAPELAAVRSGLGAVLAGHRRGVGQSARGAAR